MNYFPSGDEEIELIKFISKYQYININDVKYFFKAQSYYKKRIKHLTDKNILKRSKWNLVLDEIGISYAKLCGFEYNRLNRNERYVERLVRIASIGAFYHNSNTLTFTPSFSIKDRSIFTTTGRRFIGIFDISGIEYLAYQISKEHDERYIASVVYDIQKERKFKNIIIFTDNINRINLSDFTFGLNQVLIIEDTEDNKEKLKYLNSIDWKRVLSEEYKNSNLVLSDYNFCDYTDYKNKYISTFYFLDTEKINRINNFLRENKNRNINIICNKDIKHILENELPSAKIIPINLEDYIVARRIYYD